MSFVDYKLNKKILKSIIKIVLPIFYSTPLRQGESGKREHLNKKNQKDISLNGYLLNNFYVPSTVLVPGFIEMNKTSKLSVFFGLIL